MTGAGKAALDVGDANATIGFYARADGLSSKNGQIKAGSATALLRMGKAREALKLFDAAVDLGVPETQVAATAGSHTICAAIRGGRSATIGSRSPPGRVAEDDARLALSLGISGDRAGAIQLLTPLLYKNDTAAWRRTRCSAGERAMRRRGGDRLIGDGAGAGGGDAVLLRASCRAGSGGQGTRRAFRRDAVGRHQLQPGGTFGRPWRIGLGGQLSPGSGDAAHRRHRDAGSGEGERFGGCATGTDCSRLYSPEAAQASLKEETKPAGSTGPMRPCAPSPLPATCRCSALAPPTPDDDEAGKPAAKASTAAEKRAAARKKAADEAKRRRPTPPRPRRKRPIRSASGCRWRAARTKGDLAKAWAAARPGRRTR